VTKCIRNIVRDQRDPLYRRDGRGGKGKGREGKEDSQSHPPPYKKS